MTDNIQILEQRLREERALLEKELSSLATQSSNNADDWTAGKPKGEEFGADLSDNAQIISEEFTNDASASELEARLRLVNHAISKCEAGTYGLCEISGEPIEQERLNANPAARTSMAHMNKESELTL